MKQTIQEKSATMTSEDIEIKEKMWGGGAGGSLNSNY